MDKEKEHDVIEAAKVALKFASFPTDYIYPGYPKHTLVRIHNEYLALRGKWSTASERRTEYEGCKKICERFLRESRGNSLLDVGREAVERNLLIIDTLLESSGSSSKARSGRRRNTRLYIYIWNMARWYKELVKEPSYGPSSGFTRFVSSCLSVVDEAYRDAAPEKAIRQVVKDFREYYKYGYKPMLLDE